MYHYIVGSGDLDAREGRVYRFLGVVGQGRLELSDFRISNPALCPAEVLAPTLRYNNARKLEPSGRCLLHQLTTLSIDGSELEEAT
jgi:hypothetical protein